MVRCICSCFLLIARSVWRLDGTTLRVSLQLLFFPQHWISKATITGSPALFHNSRGTPKGGLQRGQNIFQVLLRRSQKEIVCVNERQRRFTSRGTRREGGGVVMTERSAGYFGEGDLWETRRIYFPPQGEKNHVSTSVFTHKRALESPSSFFLILFLNSSRLISLHSTSFFCPLSSSRVHHTPNHYVQQTNGGEENG